MTVAEGLFGSDEDPTQQTMFTLAPPTTPGGRPGEVEPYEEVLIHFAYPEDIRAFERLVGQKVRSTVGQNAYIWWPKDPAVTFDEDRS